MWIVDVLCSTSGMLGSRYHFGRYVCKWRQTTASKFQIDVLNVIIVRRMREREMGPSRTCSPDIHFHIEIAPSAQCQI